MADEDSPFEFVTVPALPETSARTLKKLAADKEWYRRRCIADSHPERLFHATWPLAFANHCIEDTREAAHHLAAHVRGAYPDELIIFDN